MLAAGGDSPDPPGVVHHGLVSDTVQVSTPARRGGNRTVGNMLRSLLVVGAFVVLLVFIVPRPSAVSQPPVDVTGTAQGAATEAGFPIEQPVGLPAEWKATAAYLINATDGISTWHVGYETADAQYAAVEQAANVTFDWTSVSSGGGTQVGTQVIAGVTWTRLMHDNRLQRSLSLTQGDVTTLVTGTASWDDLATLAASLRPVPKPTS
jgi:Protein of unknown function (DUF4245)